MFDGFKKRHPLMLLCTRKVMSKNMVLIHEPTLGCQGFGDRHRRGHLLRSKSTLFIAAAQRGSGDWTKQKLPITLFAALGYNVSMGGGAKTGRSPFTLSYVRTIVEASDILVARASNARNRSADQ